MARKEGKKAKGAGARALASVAVTLRVTTTPAALNAPLQGASGGTFRGNVRGTPICLFF
ncbi:hypothetical protein POW36_24225 [Escherichia coli]